MEATALAAKAQYDLASDGARKEDKEAAAARVRQAEGAVSEVESYIGDAMVYAPVTGEVSTIIAEQGELVGSGMKPLTKEEIEALRDSVLPDIPSTQIRGQ